MGGVAGALHLPNLCKLNVPLSSAHWGHAVQAHVCTHRMCRHSPLRASQLDFQGMEISTLPDRESGTSPG